jgi:hypothetical protein
MYQLVRLASAANDAAHTSGLNGPRIPAFEANRTVVPAAHTAHGAVLNGVLEAILLGLIFARFLQMIWYTMSDLQFMPRNYFLEA